MNPKVTKLRDAAQKYIEAIYSIPDGGPQAEHEVRLCLAGQSLNTAHNAILSASTLAASASEQSKLTLEGVNKHRELANLPPLASL